jgi:hypothetical protein
MSWKNVRLELAGTREFPNGSAGRAYLLRLPLDERGLIDEGQVVQHPERATVRRHWPNEPDRNGYLVRKPNGWAFAYAQGDPGDGDEFQLEADPLQIGKCVTIIEANGARLPFKVAYCGS